MAKILDPKCKLCRRAGEKLMLKGERCISQKCAIVKRNYPPGFHGIKGKQRLSDYGNQLYEKQKAKRTYGLMEKQFRLTYERAKKVKGDTGKNLLKLLEARLDNVVYRLGIAPSRSLARQLVAHGHFLVNDTRVDIPSFTVKTGDSIKVKPASKRAKYFREAEEKGFKTELPSWLNFDKKEWSAKILHLPEDMDLPANINPQVIVEFYSR